MNVLHRAHVAFQPSAIQCDAYFPTLIFSWHVPAAPTMNAGLSEAIYAIRAQDQAGLSRSNHRALGGWHSKNELHKAPAFAPLVAKINEACTHISATLGYDPKYPLRIGTMWSIINPPGSSNRAHIHPGSLWSGVYYVAAPENAGMIEFIDPRTAHLMNAPRYIEGKQRAQSCWTKVKYDPTPGKMLIFPSHLYHAVEPNLATVTGREADRMIVSFNLGQR